MKQPYRVSERVEGGRAELVYVAGNRELNVGPIRIAAQIGIVGAATAAAGFPVIGALVLGVAATVGLWRWRRDPQVAGIMLTVERGDLRVISRATKEVLADVRLVNLVDVALDTKSIRKVLPGTDAVPAVQFIQTSVGPELQVSRIVLHFADQQEPVRLSEPFLSHMDAVEWTGKIRAFLRKQGWVPADEREGETVLDDD